MTIPSGWDAKFSEFAVNMIWGGVVALLLLFPMLKGKFIARGVLVGLVASAIILLYGYPQAGLGFFGSHMGTLTFVPVIVLCIIWGFIASVWLRLLRG